jgi:hypothetical protein
VPNPEVVNIKGRWSKLDGDRSQILQRARDCAKITIPQLLPPQGSTANTKFNTPWQSLGARGVNNLASKLILALFPPNQAFFRLKLDDSVVKNLSQEANAKTVAEAGMATMEQMILDDMESRSIRMGAFEAFKHLIVTGNSLVYLDDKQGVRVYRLDQYCIKRDPMGNVLEIITKEEISYMALPPEIQSQIEMEEEEKASVDSKPLELYTRVVRVNDAWEISQEIKETVVSSSKGTYPLDKSPFIPLRWSALAGEDYGRGLVEEYLGYLQSLEVLTQAIVEGSAAAAKVLVMVNPNSTTRIKKVAEAANLDVIEGVATDVTFLHLEKFADFKVALETLNSIKTELSACFLLNSSIQRQGERVTAEEIRYMAKELEDALGGVYSVQSKEFQLPLVKISKLYMERGGRLPVLPEDKVKLVITTGLEALGRSHDLVKLNTFMQELQVLGPEVVAEYLQVSDYITRVANATGIDPKGLVKPEAEVLANRQQQAQQAQQAQMMSDGIKSGAAAQFTKGMMDNANAGDPMGIGERMSPGATTGA